MTFQESIQVCLRKYADFNGRASRSEFWWFFLFLVLVQMVCGAINTNLGAVVSLGFLLPSLASGCRRLHDTNRSGWWLLLVLLPVFGVIVLIVFWVGQTQPER
jgi:uncharacterized membrane protein YhaH (DUF805 family)